MSKADTRTIKETHASVETVAIEETRCPVCEQWYREDEELVPLAVGAQYTPETDVVGAGQVTQVCTGCAGALFEYDGSASGGVDRVRAALSRPLVDIGGIEVPTGALRALLSLGIPLTVAVVVASEVMSTVTQQADVSEFQEVGAPLGFGDFVPMLLIGVACLLFIRTVMTIGPGGFR